jgi:hypothetical protein
MTTRTRYFVIASLLVLFIGVGTGLVAYYAGFPAGIFSRTDEIADLKLLPRNAELVAYADVRDVMNSELRHKLRTVMPASGQGQQEFAEKTGINLESDVDQLLMCLAAPQGGQTLPVATLLVARGRFDTARIEALILEHGGRTEDYKGTRIVVAPGGRADGSDVATAPNVLPGQPTPNVLPGQPTIQPRPKGNDVFAVAFMDAGRIAFGQRSLIQAAIDQKNGGVGITENAELMELLRSVDAGDVWAVGHFDALAAHANLPTALANQMPPITWFAANGDVDGGLHGTVRADTRSEQTASDLREAIRGFIALGRLQAGSQPQLKPFIDSVTLGGTGTTVSLGFNISPELIDTLGSAAQMLQKRPNMPPQRLQ